jgi:hypothetical protein
MTYFTEEHAASMTLRDYFAAKAMPLFIAQDWPYKNVATQAYEIADAMLKARAS